MADQTPESASPAPEGGARRSRRAHRPAPAGVDPRPSSHPLGERAAEDRPESWGDGARGGSAPRGPRRAPTGENDERLRRDRPPHWG